MTTITDAYRYKVTVRLMYSWQTELQLAPRLTVEYVTGADPLTRRQIQEVIQERHQPHVKGDPPPHVEIVSIDLIDPTDDGRHVDMFQPQQLTL